MHVAAVTARRRGGDFHTGSYARRFDRDPRACRRPRGPLEGERATGLFIRMVLQGTQSIRPFQLGLGRVGADTEHRVKIDGLALVEDVVHVAAGSDGGGGGGIVAVSPFARRRSRASARASQSTRSGQFRSKRTTATNASTAGYPIPVGRRPAGRARGRSRDTALRHDHSPPTQARGRASFGGRPRYWNSIPLQRPSPPEAPSRSRRRKTRSTNRGLPQIGVVGFVLERRGACRLGGPRRPRGAPRAPAGAFVDAAQSVALFSVTSALVRYRGSSSKPKVVSAAALVDSDRRPASASASAASRLRHAS